MSVKKKNLNLQYEINDDRYRNQLFGLLTKNENDGKQLQIYNSFAKPRRDQVDIQRCLYKLTTAYVEEKYGKRKYNDSNIKSIIYSVFSNNLYLIALIGYLLKDDEAKEDDARHAMNIVIEHAMSIESIYAFHDKFSGENPFNDRLISQKSLSYEKIYPSSNDDFTNRNDYINRLKSNKKLSYRQIYPSSNDDFTNRNDYINRLKSRKTDPMVTRSQTRKKLDDLSYAEIYPSSDEFTNRNDYINRLQSRKTTPMVTRSQTRKIRDELSYMNLYPLPGDDFTNINEQHKLQYNDIIPMKTRSQSKKIIKDGNNLVTTPAIGWVKESHMRYKGKYGGKKTIKRRRVSYKRKG